MKNIFHNKKVKVRLDDYNVRKKNNELSGSFVEWLEVLEENKDKVFTAKKYDRFKDGVYELEGVENWLFTESDLELVE